MIGIKGRFVDFYSYDIIKFCNHVNSIVDKNSFAVNFNEKDEDTWHDELNMSDPSCWEIQPFLKYIFSDAANVTVLTSINDMYESLYFLIYDNDDVDFTQLFKEYKRTGNFNKELLEIMLVNKKMGA